MKFDTLKDRCDYFRSLSDYKLIPDSYVIVMLDGRAFSKKIKPKFEQPYSKAFRDIMDKTARYIAAKLDGAKLVYVQSDEISILLTDFSPSNGCGTFFNYRLCKLQSIAASMAASKFNQLMLLEFGENSDYTTIDEIEDQNLIEFDCRAWNVPTKNDVYSWFLYRQFDCIRNSKLSLGQKYFDQKNLNNFNAEEVVNLVKSEVGVDWNNLENNIKFGRYLWKEVELVTNPELNVNFERNRWIIKEGFDLSTEEGRELLESRIPLNP